MKTATVLTLALLLAGCGREPLDDLFTQQATASCRAQGYAEDSDGFKQCFGPAYAKARDVR